MLIYLIKLFTYLTLLIIVLFVKIQHSSQIPITFAKGERTTKMYQLAQLLDTHTAGSWITSLALD